MMQITAKVTAAEGPTLTLGEIREFVAGVPDGADVSPILRDVGTQRDPDVVLFGMRATWDGSL